MTPEQKRRQEMIDYLNTLKFAHQSHALNEISRHGSEQYAQHEMDKAQMVEEIIMIVEYFRKSKTVNMLANESDSLKGLSRMITEEAELKNEVPQAPQIPTRNGMSKP